MYRVIKFIKCCFEWNSSTIIQWEGSFILACWFFVCQISFHSEWWKEVNKFTIQVSLDVDVIGLWWKMIVYTNVHKKQLSGTLTLKKFNESMRNFQINLSENNREIVKESRCWRRFGVSVENWFSASCHVITADKRRNTNLEIRN